MSRIPVSNKNRVKEEARKRRNADLNVSRAIPDTADINAIITQYLIDNPVGGGSLYKIIEVKRGQVFPTSGVILSEPSVSGKFIRITHLLMRSSVETGMTLTVDGVNIFTGGTLATEISGATAASSDFGVTPFYGDTSVVNAGGLLPEIECTSFSLSKDTGSTADRLYYSYQILEAL